MYADDLKVDLDCDCLAGDTKDVRRQCIEMTKAPIHFGILEVSAAVLDESRVAILIATADDIR